MAGALETTVGLYSYGEKMSDRAVFNDRRDAGTIQEIRS
jgi:hypothetical protein